MDYYYLAASLPAVALGAPPPLSLETFRARCAEQLSPRDREALDALLEGAGGESHPAEQHAFVREWRAVENGLRAAVAAQRAVRLRRDPAPYRLRGETDAQTERAVREAFARENPADRELALDRYRWLRLEELAGFNPFAARAVLAYGLRLAIAWRWHRLNPEAGLELARSLVARGPFG